MSKFEDYINGELDAGMRTMFAFSAYVQAHYDTETAVDDTLTEFNKMPVGPSEDDRESPREMAKFVRSREKHLTDVLFHMSIVLDKLNDERASLGRLATAFDDMADGAGDHEG